MTLPNKRLKLTGVKREGAARRLPPRASRFVMFSMILRPAVAESYSNATQVL